MKSIFIFFCITFVTAQTNNQKAVIGTICQSNEDCALPDSICQSNKCICKAGMLAGEKECVKIGNKGDPCTISADCIHRDGIIDDNKECNINNKQCTCKASYHENQAHVCILNKDLREQCSIDECYLDVKGKNALICKDNECVCADGYIEKDDTCNGAATNIILSAVSFIFIAITILVF